MVAIIDYDAGNIRSVEKACTFLGHENVVTRDPDVIKNADHVILPGDGVFGDAMEHLKLYGLTEPIYEVVRKGTPFLGICVGLQILFDTSEESPGAEGLGILKGKILRLPEGGGRKIPQIGWNNITYPKEGRLFKGVPENTYCYFVNSYYLHADDHSIVTAACDYGTEVQASVEKGNVFATQFHPEKSGKMGMKILSNFLNI